MTARKRKDEWDDLFGALDAELESMRAHMDRVLERMLSGELREANDPMIYGFSMRLGPEGRPVVQELGNARPKISEGEPAREPLTDIIEAEDEVRVIMELPGVGKDAIKVQAYDRSLELEVLDEERRFRKHLDLPCDVAPDSAKASYKNGVLQVVVRRTAPKRKGRAVKVE